MANSYKMEIVNDISELETCSVEVYPFTDHKLIIDFLKKMNNMENNLAYTEWKILPNINDEGVANLKNLLIDFMNSKENIDKNILDNLKAEIQNVFGGKSGKEGQRIAKKPKTYNPNGNEMEVEQINPFVRVFYNAGLLETCKGYKTLEQEIENYINLKTGDQEKEITNNEIFNNKFVDIQNEIRKIENENENCKNTIKFMIYKGLFNRPIDPVIRPTFFNEQLFDNLKSKKDSPDNLMREYHQYLFNIYQKLILRFLLAYTYINIYTYFNLQINEDSEQIKKVLLMIDNLHDFGKERGGNIKNCTIAFILSEINKIHIFNNVYNEISSLRSSHNLNFISLINEFSGVVDGQSVEFNFNNDNNDTNFFVCQPWEKVILTQLFKFIDKIQEDYFNNIPQLMDKTIVKNFYKTEELAAYFPFPLVPNNSCLTNVAEDTKTTQTSITGFSRYKNYKKSLFTSGFDGNRFTTPPQEQEPNDENSNLTAPSIYDNTNVTYNTKTIGNNSYYKRTFDKKYGVGGSNNDKVCRKNKRDCNYKRADIYEIGDHKSSVQDHVKDSVNEIKEYLRNKDMSLCKNPDDKDKDIFNFFLTLKALGDYTQLLEAKNKGYRFVTADMLQVSIGIIIGVKIMFVYERKRDNKDEKIYKIFNCTGNVIDEQTQPTQRKRKRNDRK